MNLTTSSRTFKYGLLWNYLQVINSKQYQQNQKASSLQQQTQISNTPTFSAFSNFIFIYLTSILIIIKLSESIEPMSSKKKQGKKGSKADKDKQKQRMQQQEAKRQQERQEAQQRIQVLQQSGILDAYQFFLRAICKNGLPQANIFEFAAQQILKYQKKMKQQEGKKQQLRSYNKSAIDQSRVGGSPDKLKPSTLPFKGDSNEEALKALKKK